MRTGILADATAEGRFNPMSQEMHDQLLAKAHFQKHGLTMKRRRDDRYRAPQRPRAPYMALAEYAQILNPLNPQVEYLQGIPADLPGIPAPRRSTEDPDTL